MGTADFDRAFALHREGQLAQAKALYEKILRAQPQHVDALQLSGVIAGQQRDFVAAVGFLNRAIGIVPGNATAYNNRGTALRNLRRWDEALADINKAIELQPAKPEAYLNLGNIYRDLGRLSDSLSSYDHAIRLKPDYVMAYCNRGSLLGDHRKIDAAMASYDQAIALRPDCAEAQVNQAMLRLLLGDLERGLPQFEWRWRDPNGTNILERREFGRPLWSGRESLAGRTILLHSEQGFGDTIQFCRYARLVANLGARVILEVHPDQIQLLASLEGPSQLIGRGEPMPGFDFHCPLMSLPLAFGTTLDSIPSAGRYLRSDPAKLAVWQTRLGERMRPRIGLMWSGNPRHQNDHQRSFALADLIDHLPPHCQYFSLQKDIPDQDRPTLLQHTRIADLSARLTDFGDTAAVCECMDLVIAVDTSVAHLSAALGRDTWILLPFNADWRWLLDRTDSPWYPTATLHRQERLGDWTGVFGRIGEKLREKFSV